VQSWRKKWKIQKKLLEYHWYLWYSTGFFWVFCTFYYGLYFQVMKRAPVEILEKIYDLCQDFYNFPFRCCNNRSHIQRGPKVTSLVARFLFHDTRVDTHRARILRVTFAWHMRQIHSGCASHPQIRRKCCAPSRARSAQHMLLLDPSVPNSVLYHFICIFSFLHQNQKIHEKWPLCLCPNVLQL
jgi:hypothetical protein